MNTYKKDPSLEVGDRIGRYQNNILIQAEIKELTRDKILCFPIQGDFLVDGDELFQWQGYYIRITVRRFGPGVWQQLVQSPLYSMIVKESTKTLILDNTRGTFKYSLPHD
jgi:hypothetical protein